MFLTTYSLYFSGIDTDELHSNVEDFEEEVIEFLVSVDEITLEE